MFERNWVLFFRAVHHNDLVNESIECMKLKTWSLEEKEVALSTALELVRIQPRVSQAIRCSLLRAVFTSVFPMMAAAAAADDTKHHRYHLIPHSSKTAPNMTV